MNTILVPDVFLAIAAAIADKATVLDAMPLDEPANVRCLSGATLWLRTKAAL